MWNYAGLYLPNRMAFNQAKVADSMDVLFHGLIGAIIGEGAPKSIKNRRLNGALAAMSPDLAIIPLYLFLGMITDSFMWIPSADAFYELSLIHI